MRRGPAIGKDGNLQQKHPGLFPHVQQEIDLVRLAEITRKAECERARVCACVRLFVVYVCACSDKKEEMKKGERRRKRAENLQYLLVIASKRASASGGSSRKGGWAALLSESRIAKPARCRLRRKVARGMLHQGHQKEREEACV